MRRPLAAAVAAGLLAAPLAAQDGTPGEQPRVHVVRPGETLWEIARTYLDDPFLWTEIFRLNVGTVTDPARIYPSERLVIPGRAGRAPVAQAPAAGGRRIVGFDEAPYPAIAPGDFYRAAFVAPESEVVPAGRLVEVRNETVVPQRVEPGVFPFDRVFVRLDGGGAREGDRLRFVRRDRPVRPLGRVWNVTGMGVVAAVEEGVATVVVTDVYGVMRPGDIATQAARFPLEAGVRPAPARDLQGRIIGYAGEHPLPGLEEIAFVDVGRGAGVSEGDEFEVYAPPAARSWGTRPEVAVARLRVVRVTERTASARIMHMEQPALAVGLPVRRVARMP